MECRTCASITAALAGLVLLAGTAAAQQHTPPTTARNRLGFSALTEMVAAATAGISGIGDPVCPRCGRRHGAMPGRGGGAGAGAGAAAGRAAPGAGDLAAAGPGGFGRGFGAAAGPQTASPNMIGDAFGSIGQSLIVIPGQTRPFADFWRNPDSSLVLFDASFAGSGICPIELTPPPAATLTLTGDTTSNPLPAGTTWTSTTPFLTIGGFPASFSVAENPDETVATQEAFPAAEQVQFNSATATQVGSDTYNLFTDYTIFDQLPEQIVVPVSPGIVVGRMKIAENTSPIPQDRLLFNYSYFDNVPLAAGGVGVSRLTPGFEKTFRDGLMSIELKIPMAVTLDSTITADGGTDLSHGEFGNMLLTYKRLLIERRTWAVSGGLMVALPTADDIHVGFSDGTPLVSIRNESVHLGPFFGALWTPNDRFFAQGFLQYDVDLNGNGVLTNQGNGLEHSGRLNDTTLQYLDVGLGWWSFRNRTHAVLTGLAWTAELHWNKSLQASDVIVDDGFIVGDFAENISLVNLTLGSHLELGENTTATVAYVTPLGGGRDQQFDGEFRLLLNHFYGRTSRVRRVPTL